jgi:hypothetical protein
MSAGNLGVIVYTFSNSGTGGNTDIFTQATFTDSVGNTWTRQVDATYDPGAANLGVEIAAYTSPLTVNITTSDNVTVTVSPTTNGKVAALWEVSGANGTPTVVTSAAISDGLTSGQTGTAVSITTVSITSGDAVICWSGNRDTSVISASDSDTTNGSWSSLVTNQNVIRLGSQSKVTTATGTQTWDLTIVSSPWECGYVQVREAVSATDTTKGFFLWQ